MNNDNFRNQVVDDYKNSYSTSGIGTFMAKVYGWMFFGMIVTVLGIFGFRTYLYSNPQIVYSGAYSTITMVSGIVELILVVVLSARINKLSASSARLLFLAYALLNGITLTYVSLVYSAQAVFIAFSLGAVFFGVLSLYGYFTKNDLFTMGRIFTVGLFVLIIAMLINLFLKNAGLDYILSFVGLGLFIGLTAYDVQKIKHYYSMSANSFGESETSKLAIVGALTLYLDFINIFLFILRILGRRK